MQEAPSTYLSRIRVLPEDFEEFTTWMDTEVEGDGRAQVDLLFVRMVDISR